MRAFFLLKCQNSLLLTAPLNHEKNILTNIVCYLLIQLRFQQYDHLDLIFVKDLHVAVTKMTKKGKKMAIYD